MKIEFAISIYIEQGVIWNYVNDTLETNLYVIKNNLLDLSKLENKIFYLLETMPYKHVSK